MVVVFSIDAVQSDGKFILPNKMRESQGLKTNLLYSVQEFLERVKMGGLRDIPTRPLSS